MYIDALVADLDAALARLQPPRKQYRRYYATREANAHMVHPPQGLHAFLRAYYHMKSADWPGNRPAPLSGATASEYAKLPAYYVMPLQATMPEAVAGAMPSAAGIAACRWLTEPELDIYTAEYARTGFQGGLDGYRVRLTEAHTRELQLFAGRTVDVPALFIGGTSDWGVHQTPGALESMRRTAFTQLDDVVLVDGAGHWVQQEQPEAVTKRLLSFLERRAR